MSDPNKSEDRELMAEYMILKCLQCNENPMSLNKLKTETSILSKKLDQEGNVNSPVGFDYPVEGGQPESQSFIQAISRCRGSRSLIETDDGFNLTEGGETFISESEKYPIPDYFSDCIDSVLSSSQKLEATND